MTLPEKLLQLRTAHGLSQGDLAEKLEVSRQSVSKWETGQSTPDLDKIIKLAGLYSVTTDYLLLEAGTTPAEGPNLPEPARGPGGRPLRAVQIWGVLLTCLGLLLTALAAWAASRGEMGHIELVMILLLVLPGLVLALAPKHNLLGAAWAVWAGSAAVFLPPNRMSNMLWLKQFYHIFVLGGSGSVGLRLAPWQVGLMAAVHAAALVLLAWTTWRIWKKEGQK